MWLRTQDKEMINLDRTAHVGLKADASPHSHSHGKKSKAEGNGEVLANTQGGGTVVIWRGGVGHCQGVLQAVFNHIQTGNVGVLDLSTFTGEPEHGEEAE